MMTAIPTVFFINEKDPYCKLLICCSVSGRLGNVSCCLSNSITVSIQLFNVIILTWDIIYEGFPTILEVQNLPSDEVRGASLNSSSQNLFFFLFFFFNINRNVTGNNWFVFCFNQGNCRIWLVHHSVPQNILFSLLRKLNFPCCL